ncbi:MAG: hypothetical protein ACJASP_001097, partial [Roseivirga sp.]
MKRFFKSFIKKTKVLFQKMAPGELAWKGANSAIATTAIIAWVAGGLALFVFASGTPLMGLIPVILGLCIAFLISASAILALLILKKLPKSFIWVLPGAIFLTVVVFGDQIGPRF